MATLEVISLCGKSKTALEWDAIVKATGHYDFYHLHDYHRIAQARGEGIPVLLSCQQGEHLIALPLLLRPIAEIEGLEHVNLWDATSVYGYAGPVYTPDLPDTVITEFQTQVKRYLLKRGVIAVFSRLHPLLSQERIVRGLGEADESGLTVSIDLTLPLNEQQRQYRSNHIRNIRQLRKLGWQCMNCCGPECESNLLGRFMEVYRETMDRVGANPYYYFEPDYFASLLHMRGAEVWIFAAHLDGEIGAAGLFTLCNGIVQYHLGGTKTRFLKYAPMKLVFDEVRLWATQRGAKVFHLGGGVGGKVDSLFAFKAGFSDRRHRFLVWKWILDREAYEEVCKVKRRWNERQGVAPMNANFFPEYRSPVIPKTRNNKGGDNTTI